MHSHTDTEIDGRMITTCAARVDVPDEVLIFCHVQSNLFVVPVKHISVHTSLSYLSILLEVNQISKKTSGTDQIRTQCLSQTSKGKMDNIT